MKTFLKILSVGWIMLLLLTIVSSAFQIPIDAKIPEHAIKLVLFDIICIGIFIEMIIDCIQDMCGYKKIDDCVYYIKKDQYVVVITKKD